MMQPEDYPEQDDFSEIGARYHASIIDAASAVPAVEWQHGDDPYQSVALYPSDQPRGDLLILIHGGGWTNGYKEWMAFCAPGLTERGITTASVGYRLAPTHLWPSGFEDVADGVAAVLQRAPEFGADPERVFVSGHSAGGHLASLLALRQDWQSSRSLPADLIKGALPISGTYYFGADSGLSMRPRFLGPEELGNDKAASPMSHVRAGAPPFYISWGEKDFAHLRRQAMMFARALSNVRTCVNTLEIPEADHLGASYASGERDGIWVSAADRFMSRA